MAPAFDRYSRDGIGEDRSAVAMRQPGLLGPALRRVGHMSAGGHMSLRARLMAFCELAADGWRVATSALDRPLSEPPVIIEIGREHVRIWRDGTAGVRVPSARPDRIAAEVLALVAVVGDRASDPGCRVGIGFGDDVALDIELPLQKATLSTLAKEIAYRVAEETPFAPGEGLAFWSVSRRSESQTANGRIAIVPARLVVPVIEALAAAGLEPRHAVRLSVKRPPADDKTAIGGSAPEMSPDPASYDSVFTAAPDWLAGPASAGGQAAALQKLPRAIRTGVVAAAIISASVALNLALSAYQISRLEGEAAAASAAAAHSRRRETDAAFLAARQAAAMAKVAVLNEIAARLPDGAHLERLEVKDDRIEFIAYAASAADIVRAVSGIAGVKSAELMSAVARDSARNIERFRIAAVLASPRPREGAKP